MPHISTLTFVAMTLWAFIMAWGWRTFAAAQFGHGDLTLRPFDKLRAQGERQIY